MIEIKGIVDIDLIPKVTETLLDKDIAEVYNVFIQMESICNELDGVGLSAVQVGIPWNLFIVKSDGSNPLVAEGQYGCFIDCNYEPVTDTELLDSMEGCLSVRSSRGRLRYFHVERKKKIILKGFKLNIEKMIYDIVECELGFAEQGVVYQHEIDHAQGTLISDIGQEIFVW